MEDEKLLKELKEEYDNINVNEKGIENMKNSIKNAKRENNNKKNYMGIGLVAALAIFIIIPNVSETAGMAMSKIPVVGKIVNIVTLNKYSDESKNINVEIPQIEDENKSLDNLNQNIDKYIESLVEEFKSDYTTGDKSSLEIKYSIIRDKDNLLSIKIEGQETKASGYTFAKIYNIDKLTGQPVELKDIFKENSNYIEVLSENLISQMRTQTKNDPNKMFFIDDDEMPSENFKQIKEDQNFYFNENDELVLAFDEYEIAPGAMGSLEFIIPSDITKDILK